MLRGVRRADLLGAALEQLLGLLLGERLALAFLLGVTDVGKRDVRAGVREHAGQGEGVLIVGRAVVGNDDSWHFYSPLG